MTIRCRSELWLWGVVCLTASCQIGAPFAARQEALPPVGEARQILMQEACTKRGGVWNRREGGAICVTTPADAGKSCSKASDCEGECLARSNTCAPLQPLMGCNDIRTENGMSITQCLG